MDNKINKLLGYLTGLCDSEIDRIIDYVIKTLNVDKQQADRPDCPHTKQTHYQTWPQGW